MKRLAIIFLHLAFLPALGQENTERRLFQSQSKTQLRYLELNGSIGIVYTMGYYLDKAGAGFSIKGIDTIIRQHDGNFSGHDLKLVKEDNKFYLITNLKKSKKIFLEKVNDLDVVNNNLNNAYYLDRYFKISEKLNKQYPLNHHSFRDGFVTWKQLTNKSIDHITFRNFADWRLKVIEDSICEVQNSYVRLTNYLLHNLKTIDYSLLKDSLVKLPAEYKYRSWYYGTVVNQIAKQLPEYFFRLAEDFPDSRNIIFVSVEDSKEVIQSLKAVEGHADLKKAFFKDRRFNKAMPYKIIGAYAIVGGLIGLLIATN